MLDQSLDPFGRGIWVALGLVLVFGTLSTVVLWTPNAALPREWRPSWFALGYMALAWMVSLLLVVQFLVPDKFPFTMQAEITGKASNLVWLACGIGIVLMIGLGLSQWQFMLLAIRNVTIVALLIFAMWFAGHILDDRAYAYWVWSQEGLGAAVSRGGIAPNPVAGLIAVLILFAVAIGLTTHLARKDRATLKVVRYANRERLLSQHQPFPIQRFGGSSNAKKTD